MHAAANTALPRTVSRKRGKPSDCFEIRKGVHALVFAALAEGADVPEHVPVYERKCLRCMALMFSIDASPVTSKALLRC